MNQLDRQDLSFAVKRLPKQLKTIMADPEWAGKIVVAGGYIRSIVANEPINDIDIFTSNVLNGELLAHKLADSKEKIYKTENALTIPGKPPIQIITRWTFNSPEKVVESFDFTICGAAIWCTAGIWGSLCDDRFYIDLAGKRLVYRSPQRNENAGGSMLRVLKYYQRGYRIPLDSLGALTAKLCMAVDWDKIHRVDRREQEEQLAYVLTGLLREVDPSTDPTHVAHLPAVIERQLETKIDPL